MGKFIKIEDSEIKQSLKGVTRQYLVGNLKNPQTLPFIKTEALEIGISSYPEYTIEAPHKHTVATEYQYVISGWTKYLDVDTMEEIEFKKGDFYAIEQNTSYAQKCKAGTDILFIKIPSINDKNRIPTSDDVKEWYEKGLKTIRRDYSHLKSMPKANSMRPAAAVAIVDKGRILMLKRKDNGKWTLPGGTMELTESIKDCAVREVKEETGLIINILDVIGTYTDPDIRIEYSDGEVRREFTIVFYAVSDNSEVVMDDESSAYQWVSIEEIQNLPMADSQKNRISDVISYLKTGQKILK